MHPHADAPRLLSGLKAIAAHLELSVRLVVACYRAGAPIRRLGSGRGSRYLAEPDALDRWLSTSANKREQASSFVD